MKKTLVFLFVILIIGVFISSCGDDDRLPLVTGEASFTYVVDGLTVSFTNTSTVSGTVTYTWDFGDGKTSTEKDPVHTYAGKIEHRVTLTVTDDQGGTHPTSTIISVDRKARISLDDNTILDWNAVTESELIIPLGGNSGIVKQVKFDYDAEIVYMLVQFEGTLLDSSNFYAFVDIDIDTTGYSPPFWPLLGADYFWQGQVGLGENSTLGIYKHVGANHGWGWESVGIDSFCVIGGAYEDNGTVSYELGFDRIKIPGLSNDKVKFGIFITGNDWDEAGVAPDQTINVNDPADGFILNMK